MPPCIDVYALSDLRDARTIGAFITRFVDESRTDLYDGMEVGLLPADYAGKEDALDLGGWDSVVVASLDEIVTLGLSLPQRAFRVYLPAKEPLCSAILCFTRTGEVIFGISVDDPLNLPEAIAEARERLAELVKATGAIRGWAVHEQPPPLDPWEHKPWESEWNVA